MTAVTAEANPRDQLRSMPPAVRHGAGVVLVALIGCGAEPGPDFEPARSLFTDATSYLAEPVPRSPTPPQYAFSVIARYPNRRPVPIYIDRCTPDARVPLFAVPLADGSGRSGYNTPPMCVGHDRPFVLAPGAERVDTLLIVGPLGFDRFSGEPIGEVEGAFYLLYVVRLCPSQDGQCPLLSAEPRSAPFTVRLGKKRP